MCSQFAVCPRFVVVSAEPPQRLVVRKQTRDRSVRFSAERGFKELVLVLGDHGLFVPFRHWRRDFLT